MICKQVQEDSFMWLDKLSSVFSRLSDSPSFQKIVVTVTTLTGLFSGWSEAKDMPNNADIKDSFHDITDSSEGKEHISNTGSVIDTVKDMGYTVETDENKGVKDLGRTVTETITDIGQAIYAIGSDAGNLIESMRDHNDKTKENIDSYSETSTLIRHSGDTAISSPPEDIEFVNNDKQQMGEDVIENDDKINDAKEIANSPKESEIEWPSNKGFSLDANHYVPLDSLTDKEERIIQKDIDRYNRFNDIESNHEFSNPDGISNDLIEKANSQLETDESLDSDVVTLPKGTILMRYGSPERGQFLTEPDTSIDKLSLPDGERSIHYYKLEQPLDVHVGTARSWFGKEGGGNQYMLLGNTTVMDLLGRNEKGERDEDKPIVLSDQALSDYMTEHNYDEKKDYGRYSQDPIWQGLQKFVYGNIPEIQKRLPGGLTEENIDDKKHDHADTLPPHLLIITIIPPPRMVLRLLL